MTAPEPAHIAENVRTAGCLFSGIGGLDLGLERAGWRVVWQSEIDPYASRVLKKHWPDVPNLGDVTKIDWENDGLDFGDGIARSLHVDLVAGGFPCQPVSLAGRGLAQLDPRWLWPEFARCVVANADRGRRQQRDQRQRAVSVAHQGGPDVADANGAGRLEQRRPLAVLEEHTPVERSGLVER